MKKLKQLGNQSLMSNVAGARNGSLTMFLDVWIQEDARKSFTRIYIYIYIIYLLLFYLPLYLLYSYNILGSHLYEMIVYGVHGKTMKLNPRKSTRSTGMNVEQVREWV